MTVTEQLWFIVGISGFVLFLEGAATWIFNKILPRHQEVGRIVAGLVIYALGIVALFTWAK